MNAELHRMTEAELVAAVLDLSKRLECQRRVSEVFHAEAVERALRVRALEIELERLHRGQAIDEALDPYGLIDAANDAAKGL